MHYLESLSRFSILRCFKEKWFNFEQEYIPLTIKTKNKWTEENLLEQMLNKWNIQQKHFKVNNIN